MRLLLEGLLVMSLLLTMAAYAQLQRSFWRVWQFDDPTPEQLFARAVQEGDSGYSRRLCRELVSRHYRTPDGVSMLAFAVYHGTTGDVKAALDAGADVNDPEGSFSPLRMAVIAGNQQIVQTLLEAGADPQEELPNGDTLLSLAEWQGDRQIIALLRAYGAGQR